MNRITVERVQAALAKTGATLVQGVTFDAAKNCGCPIGVIVVAMEIKLDSLETFVRLGITKDYGKGFADGFDEVSRHQGIARIKDYELGKHDGRIVRQDLLPEETR
jgi:hypothetical protein